MESKNIVEQADLKKLKTFAHSEILNDILPFWIEHAPDHKHGGFIGRIAMDNKPDYHAEKGLVLNARILWTFSAAAALFEIPDCRHLARVAYDYLCRHFADNEYGGYYWLLDAEGNPSNIKKQVYAQAFVIYAFSEYFLLTGDQEVLDRAIRLYQLIEKTSFDKERNGYFEAFSREWGPLGDLRLSALDMNEKKTMNTHLHVIEGYANLYRAWKDPGLRERIINLLNVFGKYIIDANDNHFRLFFDEEWQSKSDTISYGHDVEGSWLLHEAAELTGDKELIGKFREWAVKMAEGTLPAITALGGLCHETERKHPGNEGELEWWAQAEAVVGYLNAWQISGNLEFLNRASMLSDFILNYFVDVHGGEWFYRLTPGGEPIMSYDKLGMWKCPYHNSRMCFELIRRIEDAGKNGK
ncbi:MAG: AGE family epimerase/isomerase [Bacteroidales bacterium]